MTVAHNLGFPRIGARRELKQALERYWRGELARDELETIGSELRRRHWRQQAEAGMDLVPVGDFSWYDHVLDMSAMLGVVPERYGAIDGEVDLDTYFRMARGRAPTGADAPACEMTKWFDTNYHYIVPELGPDQGFRLGWERLFREVNEAQVDGHRVKPVIIGPLTYLWLGKARGEPFDRLDLLDRLLPIYGQILARLRDQGVEWVQIDEPILALDLPQAWQTAFEPVYNQLQSAGVKLFLTTYFDALGDNLTTTARLPVFGIHVDVVRAPNQLSLIADELGPYKVLSVGVIDGRNVWRADLDAVLDRLEPLREQIGDRLWIAPSCSLLHTPVDLQQEERLDPEVKGWLAFAVQKLGEVTALKQALIEGRETVADVLKASGAAREARARSPAANRKAVRDRTAGIDDSMARRNSPYGERRAAQRRHLDLPVFPTTTIGSFPQVPEIRRTRRAYRNNEIDEGTYTSRMREQITDAVRRQEAMGLDVLVHGEAERNDMVEYFGEQLDGFAFTDHGWVQSFGSRCVKPPIIYGDVARPAPMTVDWITYAQSLTDRPVKGMLTGPVTILQWSFPRDDLPRQDIAMQIALALRDEVKDLEGAGIRVIQIDEPALREGLPLRRREWSFYLEWATRAFRVASSVVRDETQIHTHMCYAEFNDIIDAIAALDADVITIESARSQMELLDAFGEFEYPNEIGPGVYDIHSPREPSVEEMAALLEQAARVIPGDRLWVNPDCGLKTRNWDEVEPALRNMVAAAQRLRQDGGVATQ